MKLLLVIILFHISNWEVQCRTFNEDVKLTDEEYTLLPTIYKMDNYKLCKLKNNLYCIYQFKLEKNISTPTWQVIEKTKKDRRYFDYDILHRALCVPKTRINNYNDLVTNGIKLIESELDNMKLEAEVLEVKCNTEKRVPFGLYEQCLLVGIILLLAITFYASFYGDTRPDLKYANCFSLVKNWRSLFKPIDNIDYNKLKPIQGIRAYTMLTVIVSHTMISHILLYISNPRYIEYRLLDPKIEVIFQYIFFCVQIFFLISGWMLAIQVYDVIEQHGTLSLKNLIILVINRIWRCIPTVAAVIAILRSEYLQKITVGPLSEIVIARDALACKNNWWATLLFVGNWFPIGDVCYGGTWTLTVDLQLYVIAVIILYFTVKYNLNILSSICIPIIFMIIFQGLRIFINDLDITYKMNPRSLQHTAMLYSKEMNILYYSIFSSAATYFMGLYLGFIYKKNLNKKLFTSKISRLICLFAFCGLPLGILTLSTFEFDRITSALLGPFMKPLFALGIGIGILGMTYDVGGIIQRICNWRFAEILGKITYSTYLFHFIPVFARNGLITQPSEVSGLSLITEGIIDVVISITLGFIIYIFLESPFNNLQKLILPQLRRKASKNKIK